MLLPAEKTGDFNTSYRAVFGLTVTQPLYFQDIFMRGLEEFLGLIFSNQNDAIIAYCDPKIHGQETYDKVLEALCQAQHEYSSRKTAGDIPLVFVISTRKDLQML